MPEFVISSLLLIILLVTATIYDIKFHKIPNWLTFPSMGAGIVLNTGLKGLDGLLSSIGGLVIGMAILMSLYLLGGTGAGDVKLMGAVGSFLGPKGIFIAFLATAIVGGIYAIILLAFYGYLKDALIRYWAMLKTFILTRTFIYTPSSVKGEKPRLRYGVAIAIGTLIYIVFFQKKFL